MDNYSLMNGLLDYWITTGIMKVNEETNGWTVVLMGKWIDQQKILNY